MVMMYQKCQNKSGRLIYQMKFPTIAQEAQCLTGIGSETLMPQVQSEGIPPVRLQTVL
uniref:Uncharacterized protein n=1 Tax=Rhizophora mucronata TaxID=61149 RepID=A0A2P2JHL2_RHIMU